MKNVDKIDSTMMNRRFEYRENPENNSLVIDDIHFQTVCEIKLDHDEAGKILISRPQAKYKKASSAKLHRYGNGEFCRFRIPKIWNVSGVYAIIVDSRLTYIGECEDLSFRFNTGYGQISPRNCYIGGQQTNCRINKLILCIFRSIRPVIPFQNGH